MSAKKSLFPKGIKLTEKDLSLPKAIEEWVLEETRSTFIVYSKKNNTAYCTRCGKEFEASHFSSDILVHNVKYACPSCAYSAVMKSSGLGREGLTDYSKVLYFLRKGQDVYSILCEIDVNFEQGMPKVLSTCIDIKRFSPKGNVTCRRLPYWHENAGCFSLVKSMRFPQHGGDYGYYASKYWQLAIYEKNIGEVFAKSFLKYVPATDFWDGCKSCEPVDLINFIDLSSRFQSMELLLKAGFTNIVNSKVSNVPCSRACNWKATSLGKILKLNKSQMREVKSADLGLFGLSLYQKAVKGSRDAIKLKVSEYEAAEILRMESHTDTKYIGESLSLKEALSYLSNQGLRFRDYMDYLREAETLGWDLSKKKVLFPKSLESAHARSSRMVNDIKDELDEKEFTEKILEIAGNMFPYESKGLSIRPAKSPAELKKEGNSLGHCVGGYASKVIKGDSAIFFIRKSNRPNTPFYTLEVDGDCRYVQCRGKSNKNMTQEVEDFVESWQKWIKNKDKKRKRQEETLVNGGMAIQAV